MMYGYYLADENRLAVDGDRHSKVVSPLKRVRRFGSDMIDFIPEGASDGGFLNWLELDMLTPVTAVAV